MNLITLILTLILGGEPLLVLSPPEWSFGSIEQGGGVVTPEVVVENRSTGEVEITFVSTCDCLWITPAKLHLASGKSGSVEVAFDPAGEPGLVQKDIIIRTNLEQLPKALYLVQGEVMTGEGMADSRGSETTPDTDAAKQQEGPPETRSPALSADFYASPGRLALIPILAAGLLDGVNPCAFTTLVFLISALAVAGRSRIQVLQIGLFFSAAVFLTYLLIGLGFFQAIRMTSVFPAVAAVIRWILIAVLLAFAALSLYDYFQLRAGRQDKILLQLPRTIKRRLHRDIKSRTRSAALIASSLVLGFLVSLFELACTGQVYFPTLVYLHQVRRDAGSFSYLLLYNFAFILPLLIVFALSYWGISSQILSRLVQGSMKPVKLLLTALFLGLAVLTALT